MTQYVMKRGTTRFLIATPELLKRDDMVLVDMETIKTRIAAQKRILEERKAFLAAKRERWQKVTVNRNKKPETPHRHDMAVR